MGRPDHFAEDVEAGELVALPDLGGVGGVVGGEDEELPGHEVEAFDAGRAVAVDEGIDAAVADIAAALVDHDKIAVVERGGHAVAGDGKQAGLTGLDGLIAESASDVAAVFCAIADMEGKARGL
nr:hypothetical protein [Roseovarius autotrophicus]